MATEDFKQHYKKIGIDPPICHFVLGSGLSPCLDRVKELECFKAWKERGKGFPFSDIEGLPKTSVRSHPGIYRFFTLKGGKPRSAVSFQCGRLHLYEGHSAITVAEPVMGLRLAGTKKFVLSNIAGSLQKELSPGTVITLRDHINMTGQSPLIGPERLNSEGKKLGLRFPDMSRTYDQEMSGQIQSEMERLSLKTQEGVYVGVLGPELETPAQIQWLNSSSNKSLHAVGMSTVIEAIALRQAGAKLSGFSLISNFASGLDPQGKELSFSKMQARIFPFALKMLEAFFLYASKLCELRK